MSKKWGAIHYPSPKSPSSLVGDKRVFTKQHPPGKTIVQPKTKIIFIGAKHRLCSHFL